MRCARAAKRYSLLGLIPTLIWLIYLGVHIPFPDEGKIMLFHTPALKQLHCKALKSARQSIHLTTYGINDEQVLNLLEKKKRSGITVSASCDLRAGAHLPNITAKKTKGLLHAKTLVIDHALTLLGSANFTTTSLQMHQNCVMVIRSSTVAQFVEQEKGYLHWGPLQLWFLPEKTALGALIDTIDQAKFSIDVAMFIFTHPDLIAALTRAAQRGVKVHVLLDRNTKRPHMPEPIRTTYAKCFGLFHHKCALIDERIFVLGSANWTKAAFTRNKELLAILTLTPKQVKTCKKIFTQKS